MNEEFDVCEYVDKAKTRWHTTKDNKYSFHKMFLAVVISLTIGFLLGTRYAGKELF